MKLSLFQRDVPRMNTDFAWTPYYCMFYNVQKNCCNQGLIFLKDLLPNIISVFYGILQEVMLV
jgi:hypothetical protein